MAPGATDVVSDSDSTGIAGTAADGDGFGQSLVAFNFGKTSHADLAIGVPNDSVGPAQSEGAVNVIYGSATGLAAAGDQIWHQNVDGIADSAEQGDVFGMTLAAANLGKTNHGDLAVGAPGEDLSGGENAGMVHVNYGTENGLTATGDQRFTRDTAGVADSAEVPDTFGNYLVAAHFGKTTGHRDLAIGSPGEGFSDSSSRSEPVFTPGRSSSAAKTSAASRPTSRASCMRRSQARCWFPRRSKTSPSAPGSATRTAGPTNSRACPGSGACTFPCPDRSAPLKDKPAR